LHLFDHLKAASDEGLSAKDLAGKVGAEEALVCEYQWLPTEKHINLS
jgi:hypothetical protein